MLSVAFEMKYDVQFINSSINNFNPFYLNSLWHDNDTKLNIYFYLSSEHLILRASKASERI